MWAYCGCAVLPPPCLVKNAFKLVLMAFLLINLSQPVYSQIHGKWKVPVQYVADPNVLIESRLMEISFGVNNLTAEVEPHLLQYDDLPSIVYPYTGEACFNYFNYYDTLYQNPFDLREDSLFVNGNRAIKWNDSKLYYESFRFGKVIDLNGQGDYCIIHSNTRVQNASEDYDFGYNLISKSNNSYSSSPFVELFQPGRPTVNHPVTFKVIDNIDGTRNLVTISDRAQFNYNPALDRLGIISFPITSTGIDPTQHQPIVTVGSLFVKADFSAWQFEAKFLNSETSPTYIWCSSSSPDPNDTVPANLRRNFYVYNTNYQYKHLLNLGYISGVAFSELYPGYAYVSVTGNSAASKPEGIYKVNIQSGTYTSIKTGNYGHTWLKKSPDGHIYAVSDDGKHLGRINQETGIFEEALNLPSVVIAGDTLQAQFGSFQLRDGIKYFTLPDDSYEPKCLKVSVDIDTLDCNVIITNIIITGGVPPYQVEWWKLNGSNWVKLGYTATSIKNLPAGHYKVIVKDAVSFCGEIPLEFDVAELPSDDMVIEAGENRTITQQDLLIKSIIRVKPTGKLTLTGCDVRFWNNAKLIVEDRGTVTLNNTVLTSCDSMWQGVEVWGDKSKPQYILNGQNWQGSLVMNRSTIENAKTAVALWRPNYYGTTGGIVKAENSVFRNNGKSVFACYYDNIHAVNGMILDNVCRFDNCTFEINQDYKADVMFHKHVDLASVKGIKFNGCNFSVVQTEGVSPWNSGISSYNSGFKVNGYCSSAYLPCPDNSYTYSTFTGFNKGIYALGTGDVTDRTVSVMHSNFINNGTGVKLNLVTSSAICYSNFSIGLSLGDIYSCGDTATGYGIYCDNSSGFAIEENDFRKASGAPTATYIGVYVSNSLSADEIFRNSFTGLSFGNVANLQNFKNDDPWAGLAYYCNQNSSNYVDFRITRDKRSAIQSKQGNSHYAAGNTFSPTAVWHINNEGGREIGYYYYLYNPLEYPARVDSVTVQGVEEQNLCLPHYSNTGSSMRNVVLTSSQRQQAESEFNSAYGEWINIENLYRSLVDGGNTQALLADVKGSYPEEMLTIYNQLLARSPHLSREVLIAVADQTNVFPASAIFDIMMANPDELKRYDLISYLEEKSDPLPAYMIDVLRSVVGGSTYKTALQDQLSYYNRLKTRAANDIIRSILNDSISDLSQLRTWYGNLGGLRSGEQIVASYMQEGNYTQALSVANSFPSVYGIESEELDEYNMYLDVLNLEVKVAQQGRKIFDLTTTEQEFLSELAEKSHGTAGVIARGILQYAYGYNYSQCSSFEVASYKESKVVKLNSLAQARGLVVEIGPNPANQWASVHYTLPLNEKDALLTIMDAQGRQLRSITITGTEGQKLIDLRDLEVGLYLYTLTTKSLTKSGKLIISR